MVYTVKEGCAGIMTIKVVDFLGEMAINKGIIGVSDISWNLTPQPFFGKHRRRQFDEGLFNLLCPRPVA